MENDLIYIKGDKYTDGSMRTDYGCNCEVRKNGKWEHITVNKPTMSIVSDITGETMITFDPNEKYPITVHERSITKKTHN